MRQHRETTTDELLHKIYSYIQESLIKGTAPQQIEKRSPKIATRPRPGWKCAFWRYFTQWDHENHERFPDIWTKELIDRLEKKGWYVRTSFANEVIKRIKVNLLPEMVDRFAYEVSRGLFRNLELTGNERLQIAQPHQNKIDVAEIDQLEMWSNSLRLDDKPSATIKPEQIHRRVIDLVAFQYGGIVQIDHVEHRVTITLNAAKSKGEVWLSFISVWVEDRSPFYKGSM